VSLLDGLAIADLADGPVAAAAWAPAATPGLITGVLFSGQAWPGSRGDIPAHNGGAGTAEWIRAFTHSLMGLDFHYGGHVRQVLLRYFRSEIVPLLRAQHPEPVRRELQRGRRGRGDARRLADVEPVPPGDLPGPVPGRAVAGVGRQSAAAGRATPTVPSMFAAG
jgi:hypothetical protein